MKNKTMRAGTLLLALTLITSCFVGGTWAKYVTSGTGSDSARVAKFGVSVTGTGTTFAKEYTADSQDITGMTVSSSEKVVAPGTKGEMAAFTISGTPEVAVKITYEATEFDLGDGWVDGNSAYYCPLEIKVGSDTLKGSTYTSADLFETAVKEKIAAYSKTYGPGTNLSEKSNDDLAVSWAWAFENGDNDVKDTALGNAVTAATISLEVTATVTQID